MGVESGFGVGSSIYLYIGKVPNDLKFRREFSFGKKLP
ncbi:hypothetical protein LEP1GSC036_4322 [Leptospira weilii str. 2006001853]|uniref:Uncharacterized protein n=4 Tax=Leptospira weilii TaxID=28184 RepID=A0A828YXQ1_9LEPT|nr:hypothetical protein LEP1GSC036_4322 [Leptospira weilii str. 2006001853]EMJ65347.1 hypothetical protein LEP1GSC051_4003 [Leptospira sp. P2653]EMM72066.1 hypothetical protein LEP1GSC038_3871 [Leptospira weilii str. 2006001855]EMN46434.1 hypothetical protein LEP1GSC086_3187 [Leptospira weilii str. LNT 1234]EMN91147.1 hypothetical protein LEP1GSC108_1015 [Leptospira weilii str. UI 13098]EMY12518.1 hypothetical protein LEP1GSC043_1656 [Leptospira weilii str. Ecochallenge]